MENFTQKWALINLLESVEENAEFYSDDFPLHVTLAGVFAIGLNSSELYKELSDLLQDQKPVATIAEAEANWGKNGEIIVMQLQKNSAIVSLHDKIIDALLKSGAVFNEPEYEGENYTPHSTAQKHKRLNRGDIVNIDQVTIIDMFPHSDGNQRRILKTVNFSEI